MMDVTAKNGNRRVMTSQWTTTTCRRGILRRNSVKKMMINRRKRRPEQPSRGGRFLSWKKCLNRRNICLQVSELRWLRCWTSRKHRWDMGVGTGTGNVTWRSLHWLSCRNSEGCQTIIINPCIWVNIDSNNGLLPDDNKPLHEPMLTNHWWWLGIHLRTISMEIIKISGPPFTNMV